MLNVLSKNNWTELDGENFIGRKIFNCIGISRQGYKTSSYRNKIPRNARSCGKILFLISVIGHLILIVERMIKWL